jgi:glycosyltransferase involved in cell wall biosynthesis
LSVVIPSLDSLHYLPAALDSVRLQGILDIEMIVIDDGSADGTRAWLQEERDRDPRLTIITMPGRRNGASICRNAGIEAARAPIIAFLDADDIWYPDAVAGRLALHEADPSIGLSFADYRLVQECGREIGTYFDYCRHFHRWLGGRQGLMPLGDRALPMIFAEAVCGTSTVLARRDALRSIGGFLPTLMLSQDWDCWLRLAQRSDVWCSTGIATRYLVRSDSASRKLSAVFDANRQIFDHFAPIIEAADPDAVRIARAALAVTQAEAARAQSRRWRSLSLHLQAFTLDPSLRTLHAAAFDVAKLARLR